jgi:uncharacterized protein (TIGR03437 family)
MKTLSVWLALAFAACSGPAMAQSTASVNISTTPSTPLNPNFSGFNDEVVWPAEFYDYRENVIAAQLSPGWVRYPSGSYSDAFNWQTGMMVPSWASQFASTNIGTLLANGVPFVNGKGGGSFVDSANRANFLSAKLIVCVNGFTDTPQSAGQMAAYALANNLPVAVWELSNEPYIYPTFFASATDYLTKMKPYRDAIKAANPNAVVAVFVEDAGDPNANPTWDQAVATYTPKYWDAIAYHHYPPQSTGAFSQWMADENAVLATKSSAYVTGYLGPLMPSGTMFLISEFLPSGDGVGTGTSVTDGTLYGAIYAAEYVMRMSSVPSMLYVGMHALTGTRGVYAVQTNYMATQNAYNAGTTINTLSLDFGFYLTAQPLGLAVLNGVLKNTTQVLSTSVQGGATVPATGLGTIPALYAQAYQSSTGLQSVVITNKGATAQTVTININGTAVTGTLPLTFIAGTDPTVQNTSSTAAPVVVQTSTSTNPVTAPAYGVMRVDLNVPTVAAVVNSASYVAGPVAMQEIVSLFGSGIASMTAVAAIQPLPTSLGGISVQITDNQGNSQLAPLFAVTPGQANILIPSGLAAGAATVKVLHGTTVALTASTTIANSQAALYSANADGAGVAAADALTASATNQQTFQNVYACHAPAARSCLGSPLSQGAATDTLYVELYGTGIRSAKSVQCFVAGQSVPVLYAGPVAAFTGLDQVNVSIPKSLAGLGDVTVYLVADGVTTNVVGLTL